MTFPPRIPLLLVEEDAREFELEVDVAVAAAATALAWAGLQVSNTGGIKAQLGIVKLVVLTVSGISSVNSAPPLAVVQFPAH